MDKKTYFVDLQSLEISSQEVMRNHSLEICATEEEKASLENTLEEMKSDDFITFFRSLVPIRPYHKAKHNIQFARKYAQVLQVIYSLGNEKTKKFIDETGLLKEKSMEKGESYPGRGDNSE